jgi:hypothetical protein
MKNGIGDVSTSTDRLGEQPEQSFALTATMRSIPVWTSLQGISSSFHSVYSFDLFGVQ